MEKTITKLFNELLKDLSAKRTFANEIAIRMFGSAIGQLDASFLDKQKLENALAETFFANVILANSYGVSRLGVLSTSEKILDPVGLLHSIRHFIPMCKITRNDIECVLVVICFIAKENNISIHSVINTATKKIAEL